MNDNKRLALLRNDLKRWKSDSQFPSTLCTMVVEDLDFLFSHIDRITELESTIKRLAKWLDERITSNTAIMARESDDCHSSAGNRRVAFLQVKKWLRTEGGDETNK